MKIKLAFTNFIKPIVSIPSVIGREFASILIELRQVEWLKFGPVMKSTLLIIVISVLVTVIVAEMDQIVVFIREILFNRTLI